MVEPFIINIITIQNSSVIYILLVTAEGLISMNTIIYPQQRASHVNIGDHTTTCGLRLHKRLIPVLTVTGECIIILL